MAQEFLEELNDDRAFLNTAARTIPWEKVEHEALALQKYNILSKSSYNSIRNWISGSLRRLEAGHVLTSQQCHEAAEMLTTISDEIFGGLDEETEDLRRTYADRIEAAVMGLEMAEEDDGIGPAYERDYLKGRPQYQSLALYPAHVQPPAQELYGREVAPDLAYRNEIGWGHHLEHVGYNELEDIHDVRRRLPQDDNQGPKQGYVQAGMPFYGQQAYLNSHVPVAAFAYPGLHVHSQDQIVIKQPNHHYHVEQLQGQASGGHYGPRFIPPGVLLQPQPHNQRSGERSPACFVPPGNPPQHKPHHSHRSRHSRRSRR